MSQGAPISDITCYALHERDLLSPPRPDRTQGRQGLLPSRLQGAHGPDYVHPQLRFRRFTPCTISVMEVVFGLRHPYQSFREAEQRSQNCVMCGRFVNMCICIYCVLYCLYCVFFVFFRLCIFILICFVCTSV